MHDVNIISEILALFSTVTRMEINDGKSTLTTHCMDNEEVRHASVIFPFIRASLDEGLKYLGFLLKPNNYLKEDWLWLIE